MQGGFGRYSTGAQPEMVLDCKGRHTDGQARDYGEGPGQQAAERDR